jgi:hypothetical protein
MKKLGVLAAIFAWWYRHKQADRQEFKDVPTWLGHNQIGHAVVACKHGDWIIQEVLAFPRFEQIVEVTLPPFQHGSIKILEGRPIRVQFLYEPGCVPPPRRKSFDEEMGWCADVDCLRTEPHAPH